VEGEKGGKREWKGGEGKLGVLLLSEGRGWRRVEGREGEGGRERREGGEKGFAPQSP